MASATTVVLVHGAFADGSSWRRVIPLLQAVGHQVIAVQLPLTSLLDDIAATRRVLEMVNGAVVLVGHSYGGAVISAAGAGISKIRGLVYIAALALAEGECGQEILGLFPPTEGLAHIKPDHYGLLWLDQATFAQDFAADVDPPEARALAAMQRPIAAQCLSEKVELPAWRTLPSWYVISADDRTIHPSAQSWMARRIGAITHSLQGASHALLISQPQAVAEIILAAAQALTQTE